MSQQHPELADEQAFVDYAYECLEHSRESAWRLRGLTEADLGGTFQARFERNAFDEALIRRLSDLDLGDAALVFGRIDRLAEHAEAAVDAAVTATSEASVEPNIEAFHIGRLAVADAESEPVVVDWRAPVAEPFYRATGRDPMGLVRRRHFVVEGRRVLGLEDELFGEGHLGIGSDEGLEGSGTVEGAPGTIVEPGAIRGHSTLLAALERGRTGSLGDIVATIQAEQDEIIRAPQAGVLVVQGGPGTGKTVVALHRAAYLLYTYRFPLEDQGVLVIGPNRVFLRYIERVLPSLGEAGVEQVVLADLVPGVRFGLVDPPEVSRLKGHSAMFDVIERAIALREQPLRADLVVPFRYGYVRVRAEETARIIAAARRRFRRHNAARRYVESELWSALAASWRDGDAEPREVRQAVRSLPEVREALEWMWPVLTPAELLHDLYGAPSLLRAAIRRGFGTIESITQSNIQSNIESNIEGDIEDRIDRIAELLHRPRIDDPEQRRFSLDDVAVLDAARELLGPKVDARGRVDEADEIRTYGHIVIDEVQDLTPMQLAMATRRSLNGSMTIVGDIAQATGPLAPATWDDVLAHLPDRRPARQVGLSVGYRIPAQIMDVAVKVMMVATPELRPPQSVRVGDSLPRIVGSAERFGGGLAAAVVAEVIEMTGALPTGSVGVIVPDGLADQISAALDTAGLTHGRASFGLDDRLTVVPTSVMKGLELDGILVVEPALIADEQPNGLRSLYVALTRATQRLTIVHQLDLPAMLRS